MDIKLTLEDITLAAQVAQQRNSSQREAGRADGLVKGSSLGRDIQGAEAELAVSRALNLPWDGKWLPIPEWDQWKHHGNDVGKLEIRSTDRATGRLILHPSDKDHSPYLLVLSHARPVYKLIGWVYGADGKRNEYWRTNVPRPCYMVPQEELKAMEELLDIVNGIKQSSDSVNSGV